jgi:hypothetical protein
MLFDGNCRASVFVIPIFSAWSHLYDRLCGLVVRVSGYRSGGPGLIPGTTKKKVVGLERGSLSLVGTTEELLGRKSSGSGLENREYGRKDPSRWPSSTSYPQKFELTSPTSGGRSVGIVGGIRPRSFSLCCFALHILVLLFNTSHVTSLRDLRNKSRFLLQKMIKN